MPLAPSSRAALRIAALGVAALVLGAAAYEIPPRMALGAGPNPPELVGTYERVSVDPYGPTDRRVFTHLLPDGRLRHQRVTLVIGDTSLAADVRPPSSRVHLRWSVRHPEARGTLAAVFARPQLCMHTSTNVYCTPFEREPYTGDIAFLEEPTVVHRAVVQRLVRVRSGGVD